MSSVCFSVTHLEDDTHVEKGCLPHKQTKKMSKMWWKLLFAPLLHSFTLRISVTLSKSSCSWPTLKKKKKDTKNCIPSWNARKTGDISPHRWGNWRNTSGSWTWRVGGLREKKKFRRRMQMSNVTDIFYQSYSVSACGSRFYHSACKVFATSIFTG